jgi:glycosyltransferase involved in cell wall biosynthesis
MTTFAAVVPVFNQRAEIAATLDALDAAINRTSFDAQIVVVDDGSTDGTAQVIREWKGVTPTTVLEQPNSGRFAARRRGLEANDAEYCLLIDSRVAIDPGALAFVESELRAGGEAKEVWNPHVEIVTLGNPFGVFWDVITRRAFSAYFRAPRTTSYGIQNFERYPKGTTCFFAPRVLLLDAFAAFTTGYDDLRHANDDTPVIRWLAARRPINLSPSFSCRYQARQRLRPFLRHAFHRGIVFLDGHGRRESRFFPIVVAFYPLTLLWGVLMAVWTPWFSLFPVVSTSLGGVALALAERRPRAVGVMAWVTPLYALAHGAGMWRGLLLRWWR